MKISRDWLGDYVDLTDLTDNEIAARLTEIGHAVEGLESYEGDTVFEIEFTTNRIDAMSHLGLARELAAAFGRELLTTTYDGAEIAAGRSSDVKIAIESPDLCSRYTGLVIRGVRLGPSSQRVRHRLEAVGLRPINNAVDATNYIMLATGHPLHAFDLDKVHGQEIIVRAARAGETLRTLDGEMRRGDPGAVMITDPKHALALGGIMGGAESEISETTSNILLECAHFDPGTIRRTSRRLGLRTDASYRFERGVDPNDTISAVLQAAALILGEGGGEASEPIDAVAHAIEPRTIILRDESLQLASAGTISLDYAVKVLRRLGMVVDATPERLRVEIPTWRGDLEQEIDLIEEVLRFYGYNRIPASLPRVTVGDARHDPVGDAEEGLREILVGCGLTEIVTYGFIHPERNRLFSEEDALVVTNALTENTASMRLSMIPGLLETIAYNRGYGTRDGGIFEVGRTYHRAEGGVRERSAVGIALFGSTPGSWNDGRRALDFFDLKGILETIFGKLHVRVEMGPAEHSWARPGTGMVVRAEGRELARGGIIAREILQQLDVRGDAFVAEVDVAALIASMGQWVMEPVSRFPGVPMVLSVLHAPDLSYARLIEEVRALDVPSLQNVGIRDRYVPEGGNEVKTTLGMWYQAMDRSLTQEEVTEIHGRLTTALAGKLPVRVLGP